MDTEIIFRISLGIISISVILIRVYYMRYMQDAATGRKNPKNGILIPRIFMLIGFSSIIIYFVCPAWMQWSSLPLPLWLRALGILLGVVSVFLLLWVHSTLGKNFSPKVRIRKDHTLCTDGLYRWIRHPMYTVLYMLVVVWCIVSANWFIGLYWFFILTAVVSRRIEKEEAVMLEQFGDQYSSYMRCTGRFLPRLFITGDKGY